MRAWLFDQALPLWAKAGVAADGGFHEALDFDGRPVPGLARRTRVQARQIYAFAQGSALGWKPGAAIARAGLDRMIAACRRDDGLWRLTTDADGAPLDDGVDLYDQAFVLFALASAHATLGDARAKPLALETLSAIREQMASPHGGWAEALPPVLPRRQNPHMHLLEAMLAWRRASADMAWFKLAKECLDLFTAHFSQGARVGEYYAEDWRPDPASGRITEPGHSHEWVWLLKQAPGMIPDQAAVMTALYDDALKAGGRDGFVVRELEDGAVRDGGRRLWAQTEAIRTALAVDDPATALILLERVFDTHLAVDVPGLWMDSYDAEGRPCDARVPASTLYHLMTAFSAVLEAKA